MPNKIRLQRINDRIKQTLSELIIQKVGDPRLSGIFITDVRVDRELAYAEVYVSAVEGAERSKEVLDGLNHASGFFRSALAAQIDLRQFPRLRFHWDPTPENADHMEKLLQQIKLEDQNKQDTK